MFKKLLLEEKDWDSLLENYPSHSYYYNPDEEETPLGYPCIVVYIEIGSRNTWKDDFNYIFIYPKDLEKDE